MYSHVTLVSDDETHFGAHKFIWENVQTKHFH